MDWLAQLGPQAGMVIGGLVAYAVVDKVLGPLVRKVVTERRNGRHGSSVPPIDAAAKSEIVNLREQLRLEQERSRRMAEYAELVKEIKLPIDALTQQVARLATNIEQLVTAWDSFSVAFKEHDEVERKLLFSLDRTLKKAPWEAP